MRFHASPAYAPLRHCARLMRCSCPRCHSLRRSPHGSRQHHPSHRVRHSACLTQARARRSPCANRTRCPSIRATQTFVVCVTSRPFGGSGPLGSGPSPCGAALRPLGLGRRPLSCFPSHIPRGSNGGDQGPGTKKQRAPARSFLRPLRFSSRQYFPVHVRSQAQCLSQPTRSRNQANRLFYTHSPAGSRQPSINLFYSSPPVKGEYPQGEGVRYHIGTRILRRLSNRPNRQGKPS